MIDRDVYAVACGEDVRMVVMVMATKRRRGEAVRGDLKAGLRSELSVE